MASTLSRRMELRWSFESALAVNRVVFEVEKARKEAIKWNATHKHTCLLETER